MRVERIAIVCAIALLWSCTSLEDLDQTKVRDLFEPDVCVGTCEDGQTAELPDGTLPDVDTTSDTDTLSDADTISDTASTEVDGADEDVVECTALSAEDSTCDGVDDDCDGTPDDDFFPDSSCGVGLCKNQNSPSQCVNGQEIPCTAAAPQFSADGRCDGVDDDCDGFEDENACGLMQVCNGAAGCGCAPNLLAVGDTCVEPDSSGAHCGVADVDCLADTKVCEAGACVAQCSAGATQCDGGCVDTDSNLWNCGGCGSVCGLPNGTAACVAGVCQLSSCGDAFVDLDGIASNGCECELQNSGVELCNGLDDDCNGLIDDAETAALATDTNHCGGCDVVCPAGGLDQHSTCVGGTCRQADCEAGTWDVDRDGMNGCEASAPAGCSVLWVDKTHGSGGTGTEVDPFDTIGKALAGAKSCDVIHIQPSVYEENLVVDTTFVTLRGVGQSPSDVTLSNDGSSDVTLTLSAEWVALENLSVEGGSVGLRLLDCPRCSVSDCRVANVVGAPGAEWEDGGEAVGVEVSSSDEVRFIDSRIESIAGGDAGATGVGGRAVGLRLADCHDSLFDNNQLTQITGGDGGSAQAEYPGGSGGLGVGVLLDVWPDQSRWVQRNVFTRNVLTVLGGGNGGSGGADHPAGLDDSSIGFFFEGGWESPNQYNSMARSNIVAGIALVHQVGTGDVVIDGLSLIGAQRTSNLAPVFVRDVTSVRVTGTTIDGTVGTVVTRKDATARTDWPDASSPFGIVVLDVQECTLEDNTIASMVGGDAPAVPVGVIAQQGGVPWGIWTSSSNCRITGNSIYGLQAGKGADILVLTQASGAVEKAGNGGWVRGILANGGRTTVEENTVYSLHGGAGGDAYGASGYAPANSGAAGRAVAIRVSQTGLERSWIERNVVYDLTPGAPGAVIGGHSGSVGAVASCIAIDLDGPMGPCSVKANVAVLSGASFALFRAATEAGPVVVSNNIFVAERGLYNDPAHAASEVSSSYNLFKTTSAAYSNVTPGLGDITGQDPLFVAPSLGDFHLRCGPLATDSCSPGVDTGSPYEDFLAEPSPNGCRIDMGLYGGTAGATPKPTATHCPI